jgi:FtsP/CotA-like multicopper oxidase with cupredoxin domain
VQSGTYWYHSHSGLQEQMGHYGPMIIDPKDADPVAYDREHVIVLSDWSFSHPHRIISKLKQEGGFFNRQKLTLLGPRPGEDQRRRPAHVRADADGPDRHRRRHRGDYTFLINGHGPRRIGPASSARRARAPAHHQRRRADHLQHPHSRPHDDGGRRRRAECPPGAVEEFQIGNAETYDVIVQPAEDRAFTFVAETIDRAGMGRATLRRAWNERAVPRSRAPTLP